jgi:CDP-diacylglycerol--glycerol-3-phosphate 3-phosphatidyltransferase
MIRFPVFSQEFYTSYLFCGFSDIADGIVARKTGTQSSLGAKLDSIADLIFVVSAFIKLLPEISLPPWLWYLTGSIMVIKAANLVIGYVYHRQILFEHTVLNKLTGLLLFLLPLTLSSLNPTVSTAVICITALSAAIQEGYLIRIGKVYN